MARYKAGLHKEVSAILDGVWIPEVDNIQQPLSVAAPASVAYVAPRLLVPDQWPFPQAAWPKEPRFASIARVFRAPLHIFPSRARREEKRLLEISKHLLINLIRLSSTANR